MRHLLRAALNLARARANQLVASPPRREAGGECSRRRRQVLVLASSWQGHALEGRVSMTPRAHLAPVARGPGELSNEFCRRERPATATTTTTTTTTTTAVEWLGRQRGRVGVCHKLEFPSRNARRIGAGATWRMKSAATRRRQDKGVFARQLALRAAARDRGALTQLVVAVAAASTSTRASRRKALALSLAAACQRVRARLRRPSSRAVCPSKVSTARISCQPIAQLDTRARTRARPRPRPEPPKRTTRRRRL